jgi:hypothetical protein
MVHKLLSYNWNLICLLQEVNYMGANCESRHAVMGSTTTKFGEAQRVSSAE